MIVKVELFGGPMDGMITDVQMPLPEAISIGVISLDRAWDHGYVQRNDRYEYYETKHCAILSWPDHSKST